MPEEDQPDESASEPPEPARIGVVTAEHRSDSWYREAKTTRIVVLIAIIAIPVLVVFGLALAFMWALYQVARS